VPQASVRDTAAVLGDVLLPFAIRGAIKRRPPVVRALARLDADRRAVRRMQTLRDRYGAGPVLLRTPKRKLAVVLEPSHVHRVLEESPEPFATATLEKGAALGRFQPHGVLVSHGAERAERRRFNEEVLEAERPVHGHAEVFVGKVRDEGRALVAASRRSGALDWDAFLDTWWRVVRRVVLGDTARHDTGLTNMLSQLRSDANWAYLKPVRHELRDRFLGRLQEHVDRAEPGSLAALVASTPATQDTQPTQQVPQWLFAFDAAALATFRALALLEGHPDQLRRAREELAGRDLDAAQELPFLRATVLESLRLWPTTPAVLRETTGETAWETGTLPAHTGVLIFAPFFHRDPARMAQADRYAPELWLQARSTVVDEWPLIPFSSGPAQCPGRHIVLLTTSLFLATVLEAGDPVLRSGQRLEAGKALPATLSPFGMRFELAA
jgi:cytochrome P450